MPAQRVSLRLSKLGLVTFFVLIGLSLILFSGQILVGIAQTNAPGTAQAAGPAPSTPSGPAGQSSPLPTTTATGVATPQVTAALPFFSPDNATATPLQVPIERYVVFQGPTHILLISTTDNSVRPLYTPGYSYTQAVPPVLMPDGQLVYSGSQGIWQTNVFTSQQPTQLVQLEVNTTITSLVLSPDGKMMAWSTEPTDGNGSIDIYAGPLTDLMLIRQQSALDCPCFRIFSFLNGSGTGVDATLLLTDDRGSNETVQYGLWSLDLTNPTVDPQLILDEDPQQGPLALSTGGNTLLYSTYEGAVPVPTDGSVPVDVAALSYANSLNITSLSGSPLLLGDASVVLSEQHNLANNAQYHWVTTPVFSPDGGTLAYIEFSSDAQDPYDRHSALYTVGLSGAGNQMQIGKPALVAVSTANLLELGPWLNSHIVTLYGDGMLYALDIQSGALTLLAHPGGYLRILGVIDATQV